MNNKVALESLAMDLKRVAIGYHRGSFSMAKRFSEEALKRKSELTNAQLKPYIQIVLEDIDTVLHESDKEKIAEYSLMFSTLIQNYTQAFLL